MANYSFDIESNLNKSEINNVFEQVKREIANRYDFKGSQANIEWLNEAKEGFKLSASNDYQIEAVIQLIRVTLSKRGLSQKLLDTTINQIINNFKITKDIPFKHGLDQSKLKPMTKLIRDKYPKLKVSIQGDSLRVIGNSKDDLQNVIKLIKTQDFDYPLEFTNFK